MTNIDFEKLQKDLTAKVRGVVDSVSMAAGSASVVAAQMPLIKRVITKAVNEARKEKKERKRLEARIAAALAAMDNSTYGDAEVPFRMKAALLEDPVKSDEPKIVKPILDFEWFNKIAEKSEKILESYPPDLLSEWYKKYKEPRPVVDGKHVNDVKFPVIDSVEDLDWFATVLEKSRKGLENLPDHSVPSWYREFRKNQNESKDDA